MARFTPSSSVWTRNTGEPTTRLTLVTCVSSIVRPPPSSVRSNRNARSSSVSIPSMSSGERSSSTIHTIIGCGIGTIFLAQAVRDHLPYAHGLRGRMHAVRASGRGGDGSVSMHSEPYKARGGPDGGSGGNGGSVILEVTAGIHDLSWLADHPHQRAATGANGRSTRRDGASGKDLVLPVPDGTVVFDDDGLRGRPDRRGIACGRGRGRARRAWELVAHQLAQPVPRGSPSRGRAPRCARSRSSCAPWPTSGSSGCRTPASRPCCRG